jgi:hypothetical protein
MIPPSFFMDTVRPRASTEAVATHATDSPNHIRGEKRRGVWGRTRWPAARATRPLAGVVGAGGGYDANESCAHSYLQCVRLLIWPRFYGAGGGWKAERERVDHTSCMDGRTRPDRLGDLWRASIYSPAHWFHRWKPKQPNLLVTTTRRNPVRSILLSLACVLG